MAFNNYSPRGRTRRYAGRKAGRNQPALNLPPPPAPDLFEQAFEDDPTAAAVRGLEQPARDRGSRRGARRCIVTEDLQIIDQPVAKAAGLKGEFFQSQKEAKIYVLYMRRFQRGRIRPIPGLDRWRQVRFPLYALREDGLKQRICVLVLDFAFEEETEHEGRIVWVRRYQDVKPGGGFREDTYLLKKKFFEAQYGATIEEI